MKEINLREFYPEIYKTDLFISLPDEVVDVLVEYQRKEVAYRRRTYRHKAFLSLDYGDDIEREAVLFTPTLQEIVEGHIETVPTALAGEWSHEQGVGLTIIINEEGKLLGMPVNRLATDMAYLFNDVIVGNAILIGTTDEDFIGLTKEAAENIVEKWG